MKIAPIIFLIIVLVVVAAGATPLRHNGDPAPYIVIPTPAMPNPNAFDCFLAATKLEVRADDVDNAAYPGQIKSVDIVHGHWVITTFPSKVSLARKEELVRINAPALAKLREGFKYPYVNPPIRSYNALVPYYSKFRALARLLKLAGQVEEARGDWEGAIGDCLDAVQLGEKIPQGNGVLGRLVGMSCSAIGRKPMWAMVDHLSSNEARAAAKRLDALSAEEYPLPDTFRQEEWTQLASLQERLNQPGYPDSVLDPQVFDDEISMTAKTRAIDLAEARRTPKRKLMEGMTAYWSATILAAQSPNPTLAKDLSVPSWLYLFVASLLPDVQNQVSHLSVKILDNQAQNALLETSLALRAYKLDHGNYPQSLALLAPAYLNQAPADPFSAGGSAPLRYRLSGSRYVLYSVGPDGVDDGGKSIDDTSLPGPAGFFPMADSKGDIVAGVNF